jgi:hypothetical protein
MFCPWNWRLLPLCLLLLLSACNSPSPTPVEFDAVAGAGFVRVTWLAGSEVAQVSIVRREVDVPRAEREVARVSAAAGVWIDVDVTPDAVYRYAVAPVVAGAPPSGARWRVADAVIPAAGVPLGEPEPTVDAVTLRVRNDGGYAHGGAEAVWWVERDAAIEVWRGVTTNEGIALLRPEDGVLPGVGELHGTLWVTPIGNLSSSGQLRSFSASVETVHDIGPFDAGLVGVDLRVSRSGTARSHILQVARAGQADWRIGPGFLIEAIPTHLRMEVGVYDAILTGYRYPEQRAAIHPLQLDARASGWIELDTADLPAVVLTVQPVFERAETVVSLFACFDLMPPAAYASRVCPGDATIELPAGSYPARAIVRTRESPVDWIYHFTHPQLSVRGASGVWPVGEGVTLTASLASNTIAAGDEPTLSVRALDVAGNRLVTLERREAGVSVEAKVLLQLFGPAGELVLQRQVAWSELEAFTLALPADAVAGGYRLELVASAGPVAESPLTATLNVDVR